MIFLVGFMGSGKSTVSKKLSRKLRTTYIDTDAYIEKLENRSIPAIFSEDGEKTFRDLETKALKNVDAKIIATGGGIIEKAENIQIMQERGTIVYLNVSFEEVSRRLENDKTRPLWNQDVAAKRALFNKRQSLYEDSAQIIINGNNRQAEDISKEIIQKLSALQLV